MSFSELDVSRPTSKENEDLNSIMSQKDYDITRMLLYKAQLAIICV